MPAPTPTLPIDSMAELFRYFGTYECRDYSPLYERLCLGIADDPEVLELAGTIKHWPVPNVLLAAVHFLLLEDPEDPLSAYYPSVCANPPPDDDPYPLFRRFCLEQAEMIQRLGAIRRTQTNEVARCACLLPGFGIVAAREPDTPLALIEVGASAGLNLLWDAFGYDYGDGRVRGDAESAVRISCEWRGEGAPVVPDPVPRVAYRLGIDLHPIDLADSDEVLWLRALIWPEHADRVAQLEQAMAVARRKPPPIVRGDALDILPDALEAVPSHTTLCVFHSFTLNQFSEEDQADFRDILAEHSYVQLVYRLGLEQDEPRTGTLRLYTYWQGQQTSRVLALCHPHGRWIEWRDA